MAVNGVHSPRKKVFFFDVRLSICKLAEFLAFADQFPFHIR